MTASDPFSGKVRVRACGLVIREKQILLIRQQVPTRSTPVWLPPGGGVQLGEDSLTALSRELQEETRLSVQNARLRYIHEFIESPYHALELYFLVQNFKGEIKTGSDPELPPDQQQIFEARFFDFEEAAGLNLYPQFLREEISGFKVTEPGIIHHKTV